MSGFFLLYVQRVPCNIIACLLYVMLLEHGPFISPFLARVLLCKKNPNHQPSERLYQGKFFGMLPSFCCCTNLGLMCLMCSCKDASSQKKHLCVACPGSWLYKSLSILKSLLLLAVCISLPDHKNYDTGLQVKNKI